MPDLPPFPEDVPTVELEVISLAKLFSYDRAESAKVCLVTVAREARS